MLHQDCLSQKATQIHRQLQKFCKIKPLGRNNVLLLLYPTVGSTLKGWRCCSVIRMKWRKIQHYICNLPGLEIYQWKGKIHSCLVGFDAVIASSTSWWDTEIPFFFFFLQIGKLTKNSGFSVLSYSRRLEYVCIWKVPLPSARLLDILYSLNK